MTRQYASEMHTSASINFEKVFWGNGILQDISFTLEAGKTLAIVGANGAGKSSLLRLIYGYHQADSGQIFIDRHNIKTFSKLALAQQVAVVLQEYPGNFSLTVKDMVSLGRMPYLRRFTSLSKHDDMVIQQAIKHFELQSLLDRFFIHLSGGEKQRVLFARAFCQEPRIMILDEPTNHLDIRHQLELIRLVKALGITVVASLHDLNLVADFADDILILSKGKIISQGEVTSQLTPNHIQSAFDVVAIPRGSARFDFALP